VSDSRTWMDRLADEVVERPSGGWSVVTLRMSGSTFDHARGTMSQRETVLMLRRARRHARAPLAKLEPLGSSSSAQAQSGKRSVQFQS